MSKMKYCKAVAMAAGVAALVTPFAASIYSVYQESNAMIARDVENARYYNQLYELFNELKTFSYFALGGAALYISSMRHGGEGVNEDQANLAGDQGAAAEAD